MRNSIDYFCSNSNNSISKNIKNKINSRFSNLINSTTDDGEEYVCDCGYEVPNGGECPSCN